jgi:tetratricopeptide (TPR) repeat protein
VDRRDRFLRAPLATLSEGFERAIEFYNEAIALDRNYAVAYAGLADCYLLMSPYGLARPKESYPKARAAATQALALDNQLAEVHASLAHLTWLYDWNFQEAEAEFKQAILLDPNYPTAHQWYSVYLSSMGRHDEAIAEAKLARELDPLSLSILQDLSRAYYHAGRYDEAIATSFGALDLSPQFCQVNSWLELSYAQKGAYDKSIEARLNSLKMTGTAPEVVASLRHAYTVSGWKGDWRKALELAMAKPSRNPVFPYLIARIYARLGEHAQALQWLEKAYQERLDHMVLLKVDPIFKPLQSDSQFNDLLRRVGFEDKPGSVGKLVK